jgi:hypothetical protein
MEDETQADWITEIMEDHRHRQELLWLIEDIKKEALTPHNNRQPIPKKTFTH